jgi:carbonic anhydrase
MPPNRPVSRRTFVRRAGLAASGLAAGPLLGAASAHEDERPSTSDAALRRLLEGSGRFVEGKDSAAAARRSPERRAELVEGQAPFAVVVACADSRVAPELLFDQGLGDLFVVRVAGNVVASAGPLVKGSIEYAVAELGVSLVLVLGHSKCGAVKAAVKHLDSHDKLSGSLGELVGLIKPAVERAEGRPGDRLENAIRANVEMGVERLLRFEPVVAPAVKAGKLKVAGATYDLRTGRVTVLT